MASVTQRIKEIQQPKGGYLPIKSFKKIEIFDDTFLLPDENIHASLVGLSVDYLTRFSLDGNAENAFHISSLGASVIKQNKLATKLINQVTDLNDESIIAACKLSGFDVCFRSSPMGYRPVEDINPDRATIHNIKTMVERSVAFVKRYGPITHNELTFKGGYTPVVDSGDGDFLTKDTIWDFKVSTSAPTTKHTLQILMYYIMGLHSVHGYYKDIKNIGFFNPRLNTVYLCPVATIDPNIIEDIEDNVLCYYN